MTYARDDVQMSAHTTHTRTRPFWLHGPESDNGVSKTRDQQTRSEIRQGGTRRWDLAPPPLSPIAQGLFRDTSAKCLEFFPAKSPTWIRFCSSFWVCPKIGSYISPGSRSLQYAVPFRTPVQNTGSQNNTIKTFAQRVRSFLHKPTIVRNAPVGEYESRLRTRTH